MAALVAVRFMVGGTQNFDLHDRISNGTIVAVVSFVEYPVVIITLMLASRRSGSGVLAYLGVDIPHWRHIAITVAGLAAWVVLGDALALTLGGRDLDWSLELERSARVDGSLFWLWLAVVVAAPIAEELLFRGFMFRGFVYTQRDAIPSIVLIFLIWSLLHVQYAWFGIAAIFVFGVLLGLVRWTTGSTTLTILLHMLYNLEALIETEFVLR
ncbi:MAG TPA: CPBP family glutamic-type intramembrane protease [Xanthobacteraceae bacterium]|nr:CPBP family glutamic-type intramembrane protease [Xanthobacteraceae bacterium]